MADDRIPKPERGARADAAGHAPRGLGRRALLTGTGVLAAGVAVAGPAAADDRPPEAAQDDPNQLRYRETEHVRWFYARARM